MAQIANKDRTFGNVPVRRVFQSTGPGCRIAAAESDQAMSVFHDGRFFRSSNRQQERCMSKFAIRLLTLAMFVVALVAAPAVVYAAPDNDPAPPPPSSGAKSKPKKKTSEVRPGIEDTAFVKGYHAAYATIYDRNDYAAAIAQLKAFGNAN